MSGRASGRLAFAGWLVVAAGLGAGLHIAGGGVLAPPALTEPATWGDWLSRRDPVVAAMALLRLGALAALWYLAVATVVGLVLRVVRADRMVTVADRFTVGPLRRLLVAAAGLTMASGLTPAYASPARPPAAVSYQLPDPGGGVTSTTVRPASTLTMHLLPADAATVVVEPAATAPVPAAAPARAPAAAAPAAPTPAPGLAVVGRVPSTWTVRPGECFWTIAEKVLQQAWGRPVTDSEIVPYWHTLIEANRARLGDRNNADLIFPGQVFSVPAPGG